MQNLSSAIDVMNKLSLADNISLHAFINTANSTFDSASEISVWINDMTAITHDMRYLKKLVVCVVDAGESKTLREQTELFKNMLSIDFEVDMRITNTALKLDMIEVWTTTKVSDVWIDKLNISAPIDKPLYVPYDYYLFEKPVIFTDIQTASQTEASNIIGLENPESVMGTLPYIKYIVPETK
jgi:hypothetical protein